MKSLALRLLGCLSVTYLAWFALGPTGLVWCATLYGIAFAAPILDGVASALQTLRALAYRDVQGRHFAFKGVSISVAEDDEGRKWLRLSDVRKLLPWLVGDEPLRRVLSAGVGQVLPDRAMRVEAEAFVAYLERAASADSIRFKTWVERTVVFPSKRCLVRGAH
jgi:hypothetical protein